MARVDEQYNLVVGAVDGLERELLQLQNHWGLQDTLASAVRSPKGRSEPVSSFIVSSLSVNVSHARPEQDDF